MGYDVSHSLLLWWPTATTAGISTTVATSHTTTMDEMVSVEAHISSEIQFKSYSDTHFIKHHTNI
jgi:hypothetical protein